VCVFQLQIGVIINTNLINIEAGTIRSALVRIAENGYGRCESCEQQTPAKRLDAFTWGTLMREVPIWKL
jgi:RNA polymerase-binding transcription factor DksA